MHRFLLDQTIPDPGQTLEITGDEAAHAVRVKRLEPGEAVRILDGAGIVGDGVVDRVIKGGRDGAGLVVRIRERREVPPPSPQVEVLTATPKGGRVDEMIDGLSQVGAAAWAPLATARGVVDPRETKLARLERIAREACKQCGRAWLLRIDPGRRLSDLLATPSSPGPAIILADAAGEPWSPALVDASTALRLLIGPEGGWTPEEIDAARRAGARIVRFGVHTMRIETAAVVACGVIMSAATPPETGTAPP